MSFKGVVPAELPDEPALLKQVICDQHAEIERLRHLLAIHAQARFGPRRERIPVAQGFMFPEDLEPVPAAPAARADAAAPAPERANRRNGRRRLPPDLPREDVHHDVPAGEQVCTGCDRPLTQIGTDVTEELDYTPASLRVVAHHRPKYACRHCQDHVVQAPLPPRLIERGRPGPGLLAHVVISKVADHLPLHRQGEMLARHGVAIARSTLADWLAAVAEACRPLVALMKAEVLRSAVIHTDDTPVPVLDRTRDRTKTGRLWPYLGDADHPDIVFDYTPTRARDGPVAFLQGFHGALQADAYGGYDGIYAGGTVVEVGCWAHARRKVFEARTSDRVRAYQGIAFIRRLYDVERAVRDALPAARTAARQAHSVPILAEFRAWLDAARAQVLPKSPMGKALAYVHNQWTALTRYADDGRLSIDNNRAERVVRPIAVGRKNWNFAGSDRGAEHLAILASLVVTCRANGIEPFAYLRDVLTKLPTHARTRLWELTPRGWHAAQAAAGAGTAPAAPSRQTPTDGALRPGTGASTPWGGRTRTPW